MIAGAIKDPLNCAAERCADFFTSPLLVHCPLTSLLIGAMPAHLHEAFAERGKDRIVPVQRWGYCRHDADAAIPNLRNASSKVTAELAIVDFTKLAENDAALISLHAQDSSEVFDEQDGIAFGCVDTALL